MTMRCNRRTSLSGLVLAGLFVLATGAAAQVNPSTYAGLQWRDVGPHHGGRVSSVTGAIGPGQAGVFYIGLPQGGIFKTTDAGVTWFPIFDQFKNVNSVGAIEVAPSDPNIVYAGTGDPIGGSNGDGIYKSTDAGKTWTHIGLENTVKIDAIVISPTDPNVVLAAALGDDAHPGRGVFRSTDGGETWTNVLDPKDYSGTREMARAFDVPNVIFASSDGNARGGGGRSYGPPPPDPSRARPTALFKSTDEGQTWARVSSLPSGYNGRLTIAVAMHTNAQRVFVLGNSLDGGSGLSRSDDGGQTWKHMAPGQRRISAGSYTQGVYVDSQNPDIVYSNATAVYRSTDGGMTFEPFKGAPGGEDAHPMWIDPTNGKRLIEGMDQGPGVTLNGGETWSSYYALPAGQLYHVSTSNQFPYWIVASQQDTGAVAVRNRTAYGQINYDWHPLQSSEFGRIAISPVNPNIIYGVGYGPGGGGSGLVKINQATGAWQNVAPNFGADADRYHQTSDFAKHFDTAFHPNDFYVAYQCLMETTDGAKTWKTASPDLTTTRGQAQIHCGAPEPKADITAAPGRRGPAGNYIADFSISTAKAGLIWTVSNNGQVYKTSDGGLHWTNVSNLPGANAHVVYLNIEASHQDPQAAYIAARVGLATNLGGQPYIPGVDTNVPLIWRTLDGGQTWTQIVNGLPKDQLTGSWVNVVREDPLQKGLLYCGTESSVFVSFDNGDNWSPLQQNMPTTSIRDLKIHTFDHSHDLVAATFGRGIWVLDDATPLTQIATNASAIVSAPAYLFQPGDAIRSRLNVNWDQPTQPWEHYAPNPPYGAILYYHLSQAPSGPISMEVDDAQGNLVWSRTSTPPPPITDANYPDYWLSTPANRSLSTAVGTNRTSWNLRYNPPPAFRHDLENQMNSVMGETTPGPKGPQVIPGVYTVKLTVDGQTYTKKLTVINDPRVGQSPAVMAALRAQSQINMLAYHAMEASFKANQEVEAASKQVAALLGGNAPADVQEQAKVIAAKLKTFGGAPPAAQGFFGRGARPRPGAMRSFIDDNNNFNTMVSMTQVGLDVGPTPAQVTSWGAYCKDYNRTLTAWKAMQTKDLVAFNQMLTRENQSPITIGSSNLQDPSCTFSAH